MSRPEATPGVCFYCRTPVGPGAAVVGGLEVCSEECAAKFEACEECGREILLGDEPGYVHGPDRLIAVCSAACTGFILVGLEADGWSPA